MNEPEGKIKIYFGDKNNFVDKANFQNSLKALSHAREYLGAQSLFLIDQVHGTDGFFVSDLYPFALSRSKHTNTFFINKPGDFLYTNIPGIALGVLTADCLPIIVFDQANKSLLAIHAGWKGSLRGVVKIALEEFCKNLGLKISDLLFYFGPSAQE